MRPVHQSTHYRDVNFVVKLGKFYKTYKKFFIGSKRVSQKNLAIITCIGVLASVTLKISDRKKWWVTYENNNANETGKSQLYTTGKQIARNSS